MIQYLLFDVDNTLYPPTSGLLQQVDARINRFMADECGIDADVVDEKRRAYRDAYGITLRGLMVECGVVPEEYIAYVHNVPVEALIRQDPVLDEALSRLSPEKSIFTNGPIEYSSRVLEALGIRHHFSHIFDLRFLGFVGKPDPSAYRRVLAALGAPPQECALIEDSPRNLRPAKDLGMKTVLVGDGRCGWVDLHIRDISQIHQVALVS